MDGQCLSIAFGDDDPSRLSPKNFATNGKKLEIRSVY